jgi:predicted lactoylglutathione lyase
MIPPADTSGGFELGFPVNSESEVDRIADDWRIQGIRIIQNPVTMDFGRTFTALDPDGHRLRVLSVGTQP